MGKVTPEEIFRLHPSIRWVGLTSEDGEVIFVQQRPGTQSHSPANEDQSFIQLNPLLIISACERLSKWTGEVNSVVVNYQKVNMFMMKHEGKVLALTLEKGLSAGVMVKIVRSIRNLLSR